MDIDGQIGHRGSKSTNWSGNQDQRSSDLAKQEGHNLQTHLDNMLVTSENCGTPLQYM
jgi:hypothetical protein